MQPYQGYTGESLTMSFQEDVPELLYEPTSLLIMDALIACSHADLTFLQQLTKLAYDELLWRLRSLEEAGLLQWLQRTGEQNTYQVMLTPSGRRAMQEYQTEQEPPRLALDIDFHIEMHVRLVGKFSSSPKE